MADIRSTIYIDDEFSDSLSELTIQAFSASKATRVLMKATEDLSDAYDDLHENLDEAQKEQAHFIAETRAYDKAFALAGETVKKVGSSAKKIASQLKFEMIALRYTIENTLEKKLISIKDNLKSLPVALKILQKGYISPAYNRFFNEMKSMPVFFKLLKEYGGEMAKSGFVTGIGKVVEGFLKIKNFFESTNKIGIVGSAVKNGVMSFLGKDGTKQMELFGRLAVHYGGQELSKLKEITKERLKSFNIIEKIKSSYQSYYNARMLANAETASRAMSMQNNAASLHALGRNVEGRLSGIGLSRAGVWASDFFHRRASGIERQASALLSGLRDPSKLEFLMQSLKSGAVNFGKMLTENTQKGLAKGIVWLGTNKAAKVVTSFALDLGSLLGATLIQNLAFSLLKKFKDEMLNVIKAADRAIANSLDQLVLSDKFSAFGERGKVANDRAAMMADKYGLSRDSVKQMALSATKTGRGRIGTPEFERMLALSDKIAKLSPDQTTESVMSTLMSSVVGGEAGSLAQLLGGEIDPKELIKNSGIKEVTYKDVAKGFGRIFKGVSFSDNASMIQNMSTPGKAQLNLETIRSNLREISKNAISDGRYDFGREQRIYSAGRSLENQLVGAGYEDALSEGKLSKALDIAEQITQEAGFTEEKYKEATNTMSANYMYIHTQLDNVKKGLGEIFTRELEPAVKRVREFIESPAFTKLLGYIAAGVKFIGATVNKIINAMFNSIETIKKVAIVGIIAKVYLIARSVMTIISFLPMIKMALAWILRILGFKGLAGALTKISIKQIKLIALQKLKNMEVIAEDAVTHKISLTLGKILTKQKMIAGLKMAGPWLGAAVAIGLCLFFIHKLKNDNSSFGDTVKATVFSIYQLLMNVFQHIIFYFAEYIPHQFLTSIDVLKLAILELANFAQRKFSEIFTGFYSKIESAYRFVGLDSLAEGANEMVKVASGWGEGTAKQIEEIKKEMERRNYHFATMWESLPGITEGVEEAAKTNGESVIKNLENIGFIGAVNGMADSVKGIVTDFGSFIKEQLGIGDDTNNYLSQMVGEDEDLKWLKAFSDRQIMSSYHQSTQNNKTINLNGYSEQARMEIVRRNANTIPPRVTRGVGR